MSLDKFAKEMAAKAAKAVKEEAADVATAKAPEVVIPKETSVAKHFDRSTMSADEARIISAGAMAKQLRAVRGGGLTNADEKGLQALCRAKAPQLTTNILDILDEGPTGIILSDAFADTLMGSLIPFKEIATQGVHDSVRDERTGVKVIGEGDAGITSSPTFTKMRYETIKFMGQDEASYEAVADSIVDLAMEKLMNMRLAMSVGLDQAILNADNSATHMDALDINGEAFTGNSVDRHFKGLRKLASAKGSVDFGGTALTDKAFLRKVLDMAEFGGKYTNLSQWNDLLLIVPMTVYSRMMAMDNFTRANESGIPSTLANSGIVGTFAGIPVKIANYIPAKVNADGFVDATGANNTLGHMILVNRKYFTAYALRGSMLAEQDKNINTQTLMWTMSGRYGFNGQYDRVDSAATVDTTRPYAVLGRNINLASA